MGELSACRLMLERLRNGVCVPALEMELAFDITDVDCERMAVIDGWFTSEVDLSSSALNRNTLAAAGPALPSNCGLASANCRDCSGFRDSALSDLTEAGTSMHDELRDSGTMPFLCGGELEFETELAWWPPLSDEILSALKGVDSP